LGERKLTKKQREWLGLSEKIGAGPMTKSERQALEKLYKKMLPREQQELFEYIKTHFGKKDVPEPEDDPISVMESRVHTPPSSALRAALSRTRTSRPRQPKGRS